MAEEAAKKMKKAPDKTEKGAEAVAEQTTDKPEKAEKKGKVTKAKKARRRIVPEGHAYVQASYNNTIITITEPSGDVIAWSSAGASGFKGSRKSTPYAAQVSAENAAEKAKLFGLERVHVFVNGVGTGREQALRGLITKGLDLISISDTTPIPHNGCRKKKARRI